MAGQKELSMREFDFNKPADRTCAHDPAAGRRKNDILCKSGRKRADPLFLQNRLDCHREIKLYDYRFQEINILEVLKVGCSKCCIETRNHKTCRSLRWAAFHAGLNLNVFHGIIVL